MSPSDKCALGLSPQRLALFEAMLREKGIEASSSPPIPRRQEDNYLPLSFAQQRLWFLDQLVPGDISYNISTVVELTGPLDVDALGQSLIELVRRHETLRTTFGTVQGQPVQEISDSPDVTLSMIDLGELPQPWRDATAIELAVEQARIPFDLAQGPLFRIALLWLGPQTYQVNFTMHHICGDAWSADVFLREIMALYDALAHKSPMPPPSQSIQYADYAIWQRKWLSRSQDPLEAKGDRSQPEGTLDTQLAYWKKQLSGELPTLALPTDYPRPALRTYKGAAQFFEIPPHTVEALKALSQASGTTLFMTLLAAFNCLLHRYTGQAEIMIGSPVANRHHLQTAELIGFLVNTLVLRTDLSGHPTFRTILERARQVVSDAYAHQDLPFEKLVEELQIQRDTSHSPLFQVMVVSRNTPQTIKHADITLKQIEIHNGTAKRDLTWSLIEGEDRLRGFIEFNTDIFDGSTIVRMLGHLKVLLEGIVTNPDLPLADLPLLTQAERRQLLETWNATHVHYAQQAYQCTHYLFEAQVMQTPEAVAVVFEQEQVTYRALNRCANQLAHHLRKLGVKGEVRVGLCVERSVEMIISLLGILKSGGAYVPLDPASPERLAFMAQEAQMPVLVTMQRLAAGLFDLHTRVVCIDSDWETIAQSQDLNPEHWTNEKHLAYVLYTSGSSGQPKGVMVEHGQLLNYSLAVLERLALTPGMSFAMLQPLTVDSCVTALFPPLITGGQLHVISRERALDAYSLGDYFCEHLIDVLKIAPSHLAALQATAQPERLMPRSRLVVGGEASRWSWLQSLQGLAPDCIIFNHYGPTETTVGVLTFQLEQAMFTGHSTPLGRPLANTQAYVLDTHFHLVPVGVLGELYIGGENLTRGYLGRPELTASSFVPNPFSREPGGRLYRTGDLARFLPDGNIEFSGRMDDQIKIHGFRVEPEEIESVLVRHPLVREAAVIVRGDGFSDKSLIAYLALHHPEPSALDQVRRFLSAKLPPYMNPSAFVILEALPHTPHGKLDRRALPTPDNLRRTQQENYVPPQTEMEQMVSSIWQRLLQIDKVGLYDNFFELGGHSLLVVQVHTRLQETLQRRFPLIALFNHPTVSALAEYLGQDQGQSLSLQEGHERGRKQQEMIKRRRQLARASRKA